MLINKMKIWVDADACPTAIKEILYRAAKRTETSLVLVANANLMTPGSRFISTIRVEQGFDRADDYILQNMVEGDLVITADVPLAASVIAKKGRAINPRGEVYTENSIRQRLGLRDVRESIRGSGVQVGGPASFSAKEKMVFANALDRLLAQCLRL